MFDVSAEMLKFKPEVKSLYVFVVLSDFTENRLEKCLEPECRRCVDKEQTPNECCQIFSFYLSHNPRIQNVNHTVVSNYFRGDL